MLEMGNRYCTRSLKLCLVIKMHCTLYSGALVYLVVDGGPEVPDAMRPETQSWLTHDIEDDDVDDLIIVSHEPAISSGSRGYLSNTIMRTKRDIKILKEWLQKHDEPWNIEDMSAEQLNSALEKFYTRATTRAGSQYNRNTLLVMRASMNRYFMSLPEDKKKDLIKQPEFMTSNGIISKREKIVTASYKRVIAMEDLTKLVKSGVISTNTPTSLMRKVWLDLMIHFGLKGREAIRNLRKDSFLLNIDEHGMKYYCLNSKEMAIVRDYSEMSDWFWECRMYEEPDSPFCPVNSLSLYLSKLSQSHPSLFQRPIDNCFITQGVCYSGPCGSTFLIKMMGEISYEAKLSTSYSATCIKYTVQQMMSCRPIDPNTKIAFYRLMKGGMSQEPMRPLSTEALRDCSRYMHAFFYNLH